MSGGICNFKDKGIGMKSWHERIAICLLQSNPLTAETSLQSLSRRLLRQTMQGNMMTLFTTMQQPARSGSLPDMRLVACLLCPA